MGALVLRANQSGTTIDGLHRTIGAERKRNAELVELNGKLAEQLAQAKQHFDQLPSEFPQADRVRLSAKYQVAVGRPAEAVAALDGFVEASDSAASHVARLQLAAGNCREILVHENSANEIAASGAELSLAIDRYLGAAVEADSGQVNHLVSWLVERDRDVEAFELLDTVWLHLLPETAANLSLAMLGSGSTRSRRERVEQYLMAKSTEQPESLELKLCLADVKSLGRKFEAAEELYREILRTDDRHVPALNALAWGLAMRGRLLDEAMVFVERAIAEVGPVPRLLDTLGCVKLAQSRLGAANEDLLAATDAGGTPTTFLHFAWLQAESGDLIQSAKTLAHAVEIGMRAEQLHPLDQDLLSRLRSQIHGDRDRSDQTGVEL